jgi:thymidylate synthase
MKTVDSVDAAWLRIMLDLSTGKECFPRNKKIKELKNYSICIANPRKRLVLNPLRAISLPFAFGELLWYLSAKNDVETMQYYSRNMANFSDDGKTLNSAYGYRIFGRHPAIPFNQWEHAKNQIESDINTRQAVIHLHTPNNKPTRDEVCTLTLQFMVRDGKLDMFVNMRSNDVITGFTYDAFAFTVMQELMANELNLPLGNYYHNAASMHIYEKDFDLLESVITLREPLKYFVNKYSPEFPFEKVTLASEELKKLMEYETVLRTTNFSEVNIKPFKNESFNVMLDVFIEYHNHKTGTANDLKYDNIYHASLRNYFGKKSLKESKLIVVEGCDGVGKSTFCDGLLRPGWDCMHFAKPDSSFNPAIYYYSILSRGDRVLDRSFISEVIYSSFFGRTRLIGDKELDYLLHLLHYRMALNNNAKIVFLIAKQPDELAQKQEDETLDIEDINETYKLFCDYMNFLGFSVYKIERA